ncbi:MAG: large repetitive protein [Acidobacteriota bacterium]|jgi:subtilisin family serine protease|nr:large repetitive protein [Acidobacteriota bacterium]
MILFPEAMNRILLGCVFAFVCSIGYCGDGAIVAHVDKVQDSYVVKLYDSFVGSADAVADQYHASHGGVKKQVWHGAFEGFSMDMTAAAAAAVSSDARVENVEEDALATPSDWSCPQEHARCADGWIPWQLDRIDQYNLPLNVKYWRNGQQQGSGIDIYVIDDGISASNYEFTSARGAGVIRVLPGVDFAGDGLGTNVSCSFHGTAVASAAIGRTVGVARDAKVIPVRVSKCNSSPSESNLISAFNWIIDNHWGTTAIANLSITMPTSSNIDRAATSLINDGVLLVAAAGNAGGDACNSSPGRVAGVLTVAASTKTDTRASFSNGGTCVALFAPGQAVGLARVQGDVDCNPGNNGTSFAAPLVAGAAAVFLNAGGYRYSPAQLRTLLINEANPVMKLSTSDTSPNRLLSVSVFGDCGLLYTPPTPPAQ